MCIHTLTHTHTRARAYTHAHVYTHLHATTTPNQSQAVASSHPVGDAADATGEIFFVVEYVEHELAGRVSASQHFAGACVMCDVCCVLCNVLRRNQT